jgi:hypothetical protein
MGITSSWGCAIGVPSLNGSSTFQPRFPDGARSSTCRTPGPGSQSSRPRSNGSKRRNALPGDGQQSVAARAEHLALHQSGGRPKRRGSRPGSRQTRASGACSLLASDPVKAVARGDLELGPFRYESGCVAGDGRARSQLPGFVPTGQRPGTLTSGRQASACADGRQPQERDRGAAAATASASLPRRFA